MAPKCGYSKQTLSCVETLAFPLWRGGALAPRTRHRRPRKSGDGRPGTQARGHHHRSGQAASILTTFKTKTKPAADMPHAHTLRLFNPRKPCATAAVAAAVAVANHGAEHGGALSVRVGPQATAAESATDYGGSAEKERSKGNPCAC
eukprot:GHVT01104090.1.p1 GENE.GHVT01104090.1~~GHVT01104090.1.p1  ORF type:complete len:147 (+),score=28.21 GHVT01104090.1:903-1343(+)